MLVGRELWPLLIEVKVTAIMIKADDVDIFKIFPCPIVACKFTKMGILGRDVIPFIIGLVTRNRLMQ